MTSDISLRRLGRLSVAVVVLVVALSTADVAWSAATVALIVLTVVSGTATFAALFTAAGGLQFFLVDGAEFTNVHLRRGHMPLSRASRSSRTRCVSCAPS